MFKSINYVVMYDKMKIGSYNK